MQSLLLISLFLCLIYVSEAFRMAPVSVGLARRSQRLAFSDSAPQDNEPDFLQADDPKMFDMNRRVRLGRSKDEDGKSNIWSIEPAMEIVEDAEESGSALKKNLLIGGLVIGAALVSLPLFNAFSGLFPDPADF